MTLDIERMRAAFERAAHKAVHGTREERSGRFWPERGDPMTFDPKILHLVNDGRIHLSISRDYEDDPAIIFPVLLYAESGDHDHIHLDDDAAEKLCAWLQEYLAEKRK